MATNAIIPLMPKRARLTLYAVYGGLGIVVGAVQVGYAAAEAGQPTWLTVTLAVYAFLGGAFGYTATTQTGDLVELSASPLPTAHQPEDSETASEVAEAPGTAQKRSDDHEDGPPSLSDSEPAQEIAEMRAARRRDNLNGAGTPPSYS